MEIKYKKCPFCELNYIKEEELCCEVCYRNSAIARKVFNMSMEKEENRPTEEKVHITQKIQTRWREDSKRQSKSEREAAKEHEDRTKMLNLMKEKGFIGFLRTENFDNFIKIYKSGFLKSRQVVTEENLSFTDNADPEVIADTSDFVKNHVRFYYRCKTPTNYGAYYHFGQNNPVMLVFDENLIYSDNAIFCDGNAMSQFTILTREAQFALNNFCWNEIFSFGPFNPADLLTKNRRNGEFLIPNQVAITDVKHIYFKYQKDLDKARELLGNDERFELKTEMFF